MTDTGSPVTLSATITSPFVRNLVGAIGETARPFAIDLSAISFAYAVLDEHVDVAKLGVAATLLATLYGAKVAEKMVQARAEADVQKTVASTAPGATQQ